MIEVVVLFYAYAFPSFSGKQKLHPSDASRLGSPTHHLQHCRMLRAAAQGRKDRVQCASAIEVGPLQPDCNHKWGIPSD